MFCHSNRLEDGKGMGKKATVGAYGCSSCHDVLDGRAPRPEGLTYEGMQDLFSEAVARTKQILTAKGLPTTDDHAKAARKTAKKLSKGGHSKLGKRKLVNQWAKDMKAMIKAKK